MPQPLDRLLASTAQNATLNRLVSRGLVHVSGFTPSDAAHVLGKQANWDAAAARLGAELFARKRDGRGQPIAASPEAIAERVLTALTRLSAEVILETAFAEDGLDGAATVAHALVQRAVDGHDGIARLSVALDRPVIGLGASAPLHYAGLPPLVGNRCVVPERYRRRQCARRRRRPGPGLGRGDGQPAQGRAVPRGGRRDGARISPTRRQRSPTPKPTCAPPSPSARMAAGTDTAEIEVERDVRAATVEGQRMFIEARIVAVAAGRPRIAV